MFKTKQGQLLNLTTISNFTSKEKKTKETFYSLSSLVYAVVSDTGEIALLNLKTNSYQILNPTAATILRMLDEVGRVTCVIEQLTKDYSNVDRVVLENDVTKCVRNWLDQRIITPSTVASSRLIPMPLVQIIRDPRAGEDIMSRGKEKIHIRYSDAILILAAFITNLSLGYLTLRLRIALLNWLHRVWCNRDISEELAQNLLSATHKITSYYPGRVACLETSYTAALAAALTRRRTQWHIGAAFTPPRFHAWIEAEGQPIYATDDPPIQGVYQSFFAS